MAATWTQADLDKLKAAMLALASGELVQTVVFDGPPRRQVTYQAVDLEAMRKVLADAQLDVRTSGGTRYTLIATRKGL